MFSSSARKNITRSRNGCAVCKSKRLKCDEAKPSCSRCERLGISCPGYQKSWKWTAGGAAATARPLTRSPKAVASVTQDSPLNLFRQPSSPNPDPYGAVLFDQFTDIFSSGDTDLGGNSLATPFTFWDPSDDVQQTTTPSQSDRRGPPSASASASASALQIVETSRAETWLDTLLGQGDDSEALALERSRIESPSAALFDYDDGQHMPLSPALRDNSSILVEYYFKEVCGMMSCYDSQMNPYRTTISNAWSHSPSLYYITQSMAAACLSEVSPGLSTVGRQLRDQAVGCLSNEITHASTRTHTSSLLALVMLGFSLSWHDAGNVGQSEFELLSRSMLSDDHPDKQKLFFYNSFVYWRMLLSFVTDKDLPSLNSQSIQPQPVQVPHPQTGIGIHVQEVLAQVGSLVRKERKRIRSRQYTSRQDIEQAQAAIQSAEELHRHLCAIQLPQSASIMDSGDELTPTGHLIKVAEAYRCTGLLQLYRNFPDLLSMRVLRCSQATWLDTPGDIDDGSSPKADAFMTSLALHILDLVHDIPITSRTRSIQPFILVSICSELSLSRLFSSSRLETLPVASMSSSPRFTTAPSITDVLHARRSVISRLSSFENMLAAKPIRQMILLVKETWACMDEKRQDVYWIDVMMERGYETLMG